MAKHGRWQQESLRQRDRAGHNGHNPVEDRAAGPGAAVPPTEPAASGWRAEIMTASGLNLLAGIWLIASPFVVGYEAEDTLWNPIVFGAVIALLALIRVLGVYRASWLSGVNALLGLWLFASAFWLAASGEATWILLIMGMIVFFLAIWSGAVTPRLTDRSARR